METGGYQGFHCRSDWGPGVMTPIDTLLDALPYAATEAETGRWSACCPAHDDTGASLSIAKGDGGKVLLTCHAGCSAEDIAEAVGLTVSDLFPRKGRSDGRAAKAVGKPPTRPYPKPPKPSDTGATPDTLITKAARHLDGDEAGRWTYQHAGGSPAFAVVRFDTPAGKEYRPFRPDGSAWIGGNIKSGRPLYRLPELAGAERVYLFEGEKCVDLARSLGLTSTTTAHGAKSASKSDLSSLTGKTVMIVPDYDDAGVGYADEVAALLMGLSPRPTVKIIRLPGLRSKGDDLEQFMAGRREMKLGDSAIAAELEQLADKAEPINATDYIGGPVVVSLANVEPEDVEWLWPGRIPLGKLTVIAGDPGLGKSFTTLDMAARVTTGSPWPDSPSDPIDVGSVIVMGVEDDVADTVVPRLKAAGADLSRIVAMNSVKTRESGKLTERLFNLEDVAPLEQTIQQTPGASLIVIDPISAFTGSADSHNNADVRGLLAPLAVLAAKHRVAVVCVSHLNKSSNGPAIYRTMGSVAFTAAARAAYGVVKDKTDPARRLFLPIKANLAPDEHGLAYRIVPSDTPGVARVEWDSVPVDISADDAFAPEERQPGPDRTRPTGRKRKHGYARRWPTAPVPLRIRPMKQSTGRGSASGRWNVLAKR